VSLRVDGTHALLRVCDTGVGVPSAELPRLFERFHRIEGSEGRTYEGTGIGLALVQELVALHRGSIDVESEPGRGSTFTVAIPRGRAHLPPDQVVERSPGGGTAGDAAVHRAYEEVSSWLPGADQDLARDELEPVPVDDPLPSAVQASRRRARILLADDNADMREYVRRLLSSRYDVEAVADGAAALECALARPPDLVLADVMMPGEVRHAPCAVPQEARP
jgi:hypothetical protein